MKKILLSIIMLCLCMGCSFLRDPCAVVTPQILPIQSKLADAQRAILEVERSGIRDHIPDAQKPKFDEALKQAWGGYTIANQVAAFAAESCSKPDLSHAIKLIIEAWDIIRPFIGLFGGPGSPSISDPILWTEQ